MKTIFILLLGIMTLSAGNFTLESKDLKGQLTKVQEFNGFGCTGKNISPELHWKGEPKETKSFAITVFDPDAPTGSGWWHWLVVNIPVNVHEIPADASAKHLLPKGAVETMTDFGKPGFGGPCPPKGDKPHRYVFTVHALDVEKLPVESKSDSALVGFMINQHTIQKASLVSYYQR